MRRLTKISRQFPTLKQLARPSGKTSPSNFSGEGCDHVVHAKSGLAWLAFEFKSF